MHNFGSLIELLKGGVVDDAAVGVLAAALGDGRLDLAALLGTLLRRVPDLRDRLPSARAASRSRRMLSRDAVTSRAASMLASV